jgi:transposase
MPEREQRRMNEKSARYANWPKAITHPLIGSFMRRLVIQSWAGKTPNEIAAELKRQPKTVRVHLTRLNREGISELGMRSGSGRKPRLTERERSRVLALLKQPPPGRLERRADEMVAGDEQGSAQWSLDALTEAAHGAGIRVERSQISRMYLREGVRLTTHPQSANERGSRLCPKRTTVVTYYTQPRSGTSHQRHQRHH